MSMSACDDAPPPPRQRRAWISLFEIGIAMNSIDAGLGRKPGAPIAIFVLTTYRFRCVTLS
jgi:hypothetical protein